MNVTSLGMSLELSNRVDIYVVGTTSLSEVMQTDLHSNDSVDVP